MLLLHPFRKETYSAECHRRRSAESSPFWLCSLSYFPAAKEREESPRWPRAQSQTLVNIVNMMKKDGDSGGSETPHQFSLNFSLADVSLGEKGDAALFEVTKSRLCVYPINSTSGEIWEALCCHLLSPLNERHKPVHDFLRVCGFFLSSYFSVIHFATLFVTAHAVQSSPMDRSSQTTLCSGFWVLVFLVLFCIFPCRVLSCCYANIKPEPQQQSIYTSWHPETRTQSLISWLFFPALDDDTVFLWDKMKTLPFTFVLLLPSQFVCNICSCWILYWQKHKTNCILFFFLSNLQFDTLLGFSWRILNCFPFSHKQMPESYLNIYS